MCNTPLATNSLLDWKAEWNGIGTYDDLIRTNVAFLEGHMFRTPYHHAPLDSETAPLVPRLVQLNKLGFVSTNGQPAKIDERVNDEGQVLICEQKSYIDGYMLADRLPLLQAFAEARRDECYVYACSTRRHMHTTTSREIFHTFPAGVQRYNVTRYGLRGEPLEEATDIWIQPHDYMGAYREFPAIARLLMKQCIVVTVAGRDYGRGSVEDLLLEFLSAC